MTLYAPSRVFGWLPPSASGCVLWLKPDDGDITTPGGSVSSWTDRSGAGIVSAATQATGAQQPTHTSYSKVTFDGSNDALSLGALSPALASGAMTFGVRFRLASAPASTVSYRLCTLNQGTNLAFALSFTNSGSYAPISFQGLCGTGVASAVGFSPTLDTFTHRMIITYSGGTNTATGSYTATYDGAPQSISSTGAFLITSGDLGSIAAKLSSGNVPTLCMPGDIFKLTMHNRVLSASDLASLDTYLSS